MYIPIDEKMSAPPDSVEMTSTNDDDAPATEIVTLRSLMQRLIKQIVGALGGLDALQMTVERISVARGRNTRDTRPVCLPFTHLLNPVASLLGKRRSKDLI